MIRKVCPDDAGSIASIYNHYVENTTITFETESVLVEEMRGRIAEISEKYPYFVYEKSGYVVAYCYASSWKKKAAYNHTVESTVYVDPALRGKGVGELLMNELINELRNRQCFHAIIACITVPNPQSVGLHKKLGFKQVSEFKEVGYKFDKWLDVGDFELLL